MILKTTFSDSIPQQNRDPQADYGLNEGTSLHPSPVENDPRAEQARALLSIAERLEQMGRAQNDNERASLENALRDNSKLWGLFYEAAINNVVAGYKNLLDYNITRLAHYVFKKNTLAMTQKNPDDIGVLVSLNREIAAGLTKRAA